MPEPPRTKPRSTLMTRAEIDQRKQILAVLLWMELAMALLIGLVNFRIGSIPDAIMLFATAAACLPAILLNQRGFYALAGGIATLMVLATIDFALYGAGGLHDSAVVTFPIFVMLGTLLFTRRSLPYFLAAALASEIGLGVMELSRGDPALLPRNLADVIIISLLTIGSGLLVWIIVGSLEQNLERARESEAELRQAYDRTLEGWAKALEFRDPGTHGHTQRVVRLCMRLAREWGFNEEQMSHIQRGAMLHDIGKMAIPDGILLKRGPLTAGEWQVMRRHPTVGRDLLAGIPYLRPALDIPAAHHERWDGSGYPNGLKGRHIPLEARIFAVVDHYDALSSARPYRKAWPRSKVVEYIKANTGRIFDPEVSSAFLRLYDAKAFGPDA